MQRLSIQRRFNGAAAVIATGVVAINFIKRPPPPFHTCMHVHSCDSDCDDRDNFKYGNVNPVSTILSCKTSRPITAYDQSF